MRISGSVAAASIRAIAERHPGLRDLRARLVRDLEVPPREADAFISRLVANVIDHVGGMYVGESMSAMRRVADLREELHGVVDAVVSGRSLPRETTGQNLERIFSDLQREITSLITPEQRSTKMTDLELPVVMRDLDDVITPARPGQGVHTEPLGVMRAALDDLPANQRDALRRASDLAGSDVAKAIFAESDSAQRGHVTDMIFHLREAGWSQADIDAAVAAIEQMGRARSRGNRLPGSQFGNAVDAVLPSLPAELQGLVRADIWLLQDVAVTNPQQLRAMFDTWVTNGRKGNFRNYVWREMRSGMLPTVGERDAAHALSGASRAPSGQPTGVAGQAPYRNLELIKEPKGNPREGGTDLIAVADDGRVVVVDDKSHRGTSVSSVTAMMENLVQNVLGTGSPNRVGGDVAQIRAELARAYPSGPPAHLLDALGRYERAAQRIDTLTAGWTQADWQNPSQLNQIRSILASERVDLRITSARGNVAEVTARLDAMGIAVIPDTPTGGGPLPIPRENYPRPETP
jgi:hypothetical protein